MSLSAPARNIAWFLACHVAVAAQAVEVPIQVVPLVPSDATTTWSPRVVSVGVPLSAEHGIDDVSQLGFRGSGAAQFRVLQRDPATKQVRWVQVHFLAQDPDDDFALTRGQGSFGGTALARTSAEEIIVDTGKATFRIARRASGLLDSVELQGNRVAGTRWTPALTPGKARTGGTTQENPVPVPPVRGGGLVVLSQGERYESTRATDTTTGIEENGPVRCVVLQRGTLRNADGVRHLAYTARLVFDRHATSCRVFVTLRNADESSLSPRVFDAAWLELPLSPVPERQVTAWVDGQTWSATLDATQSASVYQADNEHLRTGRTSRIVGDLCGEDGVQLRFGDQELVSLGNVHNRVDGLLHVRGPVSTVMAGMRDMAAQFPSGFHLQDDLLSVDLFSRQNAQSDLLFAWGAHETRELLFDFGRSSDAGASDVGRRSGPVLQRLQAPWIGRCSFEHYRDTGAVFGETRLVSLKEQRSFFAAQGRSWSLRDLDSDELEYERQYSFRTTGGGNQFDQDLTRLVDFLRANHTGRFLQARLNVLWKADQAVWHSDDFDMGLYQNGIHEVDAPDPDTFHGKGAGSVFDDEHPHWPSMLLYYWLTGDERIRAAIEDYGEYRLYRAGHPYWGAVHGGAINHFRLWSRAYRDVALLYEFTGQQRYLEALRTMTRTLTESVESSTSRGRNLQRGYFWFGDPEGDRRRIHLFFLTEIHPIAVREALRVLPAGDPLREELRDHLTGLAWFTLREARVEPQAPGYPYGYYPDEPNLETGNRGDQTGVLLAHGYAQTGHPDFIEAARDLAWRVVQDQHELRASELSTHARIHAWMHRDEVAVDFLVPRVEPHEDGSFTLRWPVPAGARSYVVKYGRKPLVPNLDFDHKSRTYRVDPSRAVNFWAASNLAGEPAPGSPGSEQVWRTPVLPAGLWHFAVQVQRDGTAGAAVDVEDFQAYAGDGAVSLSWKLDPSTRGSLESIGVERAPRSSGPWTAMSKSGAEESMSFEDTGVQEGEVWFYRLRLRLLDGSTSWSRPIEVRTASERWGMQFLSPRDPPGASGVAISYRLVQASSSVQLSIYDVRGRRIRTLPQGRQLAGVHHVRWDRHNAVGHRVRRGLYFLRLENERQQRSRKLLLP